MHYSMLAVSSICGLAIAWPSCYTATYFFLLMQGLRPTNEILPAAEALGERQVQRYYDINHPQPKGSLVGWCALEVGLARAANRQPYDDKIQVAKSIFDKERTDNLRELAQSRLSATFGSIYLPLFIQRAKGQLPGRTPRAIRAQLGALLGRLNSASAGAIPNEAISHGARAEILTQICLSEKRVVFPTSPREEQNRFGTFNHDCYPFPPKRPVQVKYKRDKRGASPGVRHILVAPTARVALEETEVAWLVGDPRFASSNETAQLEGYFDLAAHLAVVATTGSLSRAERDGYDSLQGAFNKIMR